MNYKKLLFPIGGGAELQQRLYGAIMIAKYLNIELDILKCDLKPGSTLEKNSSIPKHMLEELNTIIEHKFEEENIEFIKMYKDISKKFDFEDSVNLKVKEGLRSKIIEQDSKFSDLILAAAPPLGVATATFETAVLKSGKPVIMFPRELKSFAMDSIVIGWNNSTEASRTVTLALDILKKAQKVHIVSSKEYTEHNNSLQQLQEYLALHDIDASTQIVRTTRIPGESILNAALDGNFDLIVAGAYGREGLKELMFGGSTRYLLENSTKPVFMSH